MKRIKLDNLDNIVITSLTEMKESCFIGFDTIEKTDINKSKYELENNTQKYYFLEKLGNNSIFVSEDYLFETLLSEYIESIQSNEIYEHGYPESRLIPSNHHDSCQESYLEHVVDKVSEKVKDIINYYF